VLFGDMPSKYSNRTYYDPKVLECFKREGYVVTHKIENTKKNYDIAIESLLIHNEKQIMVRADLSTEKKTEIITLDILYNLKNGEINAQIDFDEINKFVKEKKRANIQLVKSEMGHLDTEEYDLPVPDMDLELNYGSEFKKIHDIIIKRLNKTNDKGIILLHGDPGTGKTSYLKYLTKYVQDKDILFIPPSMAEMLSEPSIIPFLMEKKNSILIIEDAERVISDREGNGSPAGVSNILNLTDGILGDCLNIQVIATFNMKRERIDQALLRKGRLIAEHKFERLPVDETNKLLDHLGKNHKSTEPMSLADIYNVDSDEVRITKEKKSIGFQ
jgi:SpoVK/Ycf46/Vps4 family AAA+-type ATPase